MNREKVILEIQRLTMASDSLNQVASVLEYISELGLAIDDQLYSPIMSGAVTTYARNFVSANGLGPLPKSYRNFESNELQEIHDLVMRTRHKIYAHRDLTEKPDSMTGLYEVKVWFEKDNLCLKGSMLDLNPQWIAHFQKLVSWQDEKVKIDISKKLESLGNDGVYIKNKVYILGKDFP